MPRVYRSTLLLVAALLATPQFAHAQWQHLGDVTSYELDGAVLTLHCGQAVVRVAAHNADVVRIRVAPTGTFGRDFSWAVLNTAPQGRLEKTAETDAQLTVSNGRLSVLVHRRPCRLEVRDRDGHVLVADDAARGMAWQAAPDGQPWEADRPRPVHAWHKLDDWTAIYGLGEKTGPLNKRGLTWTMWNTDAYGYGPSRDPIYKSVPFFLSGRDGRFHGLFFDNPWRSSFDLGHRENNVLSLGADGGELNYYVIAGPDPKDVIRRYTDLTGRMELPPRWSLGYHQCRYSYFPESRVREIAETFREKRIPCDVLYFDIDYMDGYRCFTWNPQWFPKPRALIDDLHALGFHTIAIIDPAIKHEPGYFVYDQGTAQDAWVKRPNGQVYVGRVWPGKAVFPDFTDPAVRDWWADLYPPFHRGCGIDGIWNDMNEPADFDGPNHSVPLDLRHHNEGEPASHLACHNIYGMQMVRATVEGLKRASPDLRPFAITRATYAGGQRYGATWTGDNTSNWEHLRMSLPMVLNLGASGIPFVGPDIGGFAGGATPELYARWIQVGSLFPFCRTHTAWGNPDQEPWSYGPEVEEIARKSLELRYALLPYLYTLFEEASRTGIPVMRPMWLEFPREGWGEHTFMLGSNLCVVPILRPEAPAFTHWLPPGAWFDVHTGLLYQNGEPVLIDADLRTLPLFVRAGSIIPMQSPVQSTVETPAEPLILDVWPFGESMGTLYEDDGATLAYQRGEFRRTSFHCVADESAVELAIAAPEGSYRPSPRSPLVRLHALPAPVDRVTCRYDSGAQPTVAGGGVATTDHPVEPEPRDGTNTSLSRPARAADFLYDATARAWLVRMLPDDGRPQRLHVELRKKPAVAAASFAYDLSDVASTVVHHNDLLTPTTDGRGLRLAVHSTWDPFIVLARRELDADQLTTLHVRLSAQHTRRIGIHFSTVNRWSSAGRAYLSFETVPDGSMRDYTIDLKKASGGKWAGTVYSVRVDFDDGVQPAELIRIESLSFAPGSADR